MNYKIKRGEQEFGPYSLAEIRQYFGEGRIIATDLAKSEAMDAWLPMTKVIGGLEMDHPLGADIVPGTRRSPANFIRPPDLHWALVLLLTVVTCGIFGIVWIFIQAAWAKKADPSSKAAAMFALYIALLVPYVLAMLSEERTWNLVGLFFYVACVVCYIVGIFSIRRAMHRHYKDAPFRVHLNGALTFFFNIYYFQYHFNRINEWHATGIPPR